MVNTSFHDELYLACGGINFIRSIFFFYQNVIFHV
jgi:hypothetical protein